MQDMLAAVCSLPETMPCLVEDVFRPTFAVHGFSTADHLSKCRCALSAAVSSPQVVTELGTADIDARLEELLIDGILYAFQEQVSDDANVMLNGFGTVVNALKARRSRCVLAGASPLPCLMAHAVLVD